MSKTKVFDVSDGDRYNKARKKASACRSNHKKSKKQKHSTSSSSSSSSSTENTDSETSHTGVLAKELDLVAKNQPQKPDRKFWRYTLLNKAL